MLRVTLLGLMALLVACSNRATSQDQGGPIWPDLRPDRQVPDRARDVAASSSDRAAADSWPYDFSPEGKPQSPWYPETLFTMQDLHAVACVAGHVFLVGEAGTLLHRGPNDQYFLPQELPAQSTANLRTVSFADTSLGVTAGQDAQIWQSTDLGEHWTVASQCSSYVFATFYALHLASAQEGFGAGVTTGAEGGLKYFNPPGSGWICSSPSFPTKIFYDVFRRGSLGWAVGDTGGQIYRSEDQGLSWTALAAGSSSTLRGIFFPPGSSTVGVAVGDGGAIVRSTDGEGKVWAAVTSSTTAALWDVFFWDDQSGWAVGANGTILHSADAGVTWSSQTSGIGSRLEAVCFTSASEGWAVGEGGKLLHTTTGGK